MTTTYKNKQQHQQTSSNTWTTTYPEISDEEIIQILISRFNKLRPTPQAQHDEMPAFTIEVTLEEMETFDLPDVRIEQQ